MLNYKDPLKKDILINILMQIGQQKDFTRGNKFTFVELFECLPSVVLLAISDYYIEVM